MLQAFGAEALLLLTAEENQHIALEPLKTARAKQHNSALFH